VAIFNDLIEANGGHFGESPCFKMVKQILHSQYGIINKWKLHRVLAKEKSSHLPKEVKKEFKNKFK
jgi:hypothetical protein